MGKHILIDFDSTCVPTHDAVLNLYREETNDYSTILNDETLEWNMGKVCPLWTPKDIDNVFANPKLFQYLELFPNVNEVMGLLKFDGHRIEELTLHRIEGIEVKTSWIYQNMPYVDKITVLPIYKNQPFKFDKSSVVGDVIIDDKIECLLTNPSPIKICYGNYSWNKNWDGYRVTNWLELYDLLKILLKD